MFLRGWANESAPLYSQWATRFSKHPQKSGKLRTLAAHIQGYKLQTTTMISEPKMTMESGKIILTILLYKPGSLGQKIRQLVLQKNLYSIVLCTCFLPWNQRKDKFMKHIIIASKLSGDSIKRFYWIYQKIQQFLLRLIQSFQKLNQKNGCSLVLISKMDIWGRVFISQK